MFLLNSALVLLSLLSFSTAAPTTHNCNQLTEPLTASELHQILGRWILIEGFSNNDIFNLGLESTESMWMELNTTAENNTLLLTLGNKLYQQHLGPGKFECLRSAHNLSIISDKPLEIHLEVASSNYRFLQNCPDCHHVIMHMHTKENNYQLFYLFGRNATLAASDLETFRNQAACLHFPQPAKFHYDSNKELCPW